jgi:putative oxidoreductase
MLGELAAYSDLASLVIRVLVGVLMIIHGYPKGFVKEARQQMIPMMQSVGVPRAGFEVAAILEFFGGLFLLLGLLTRLIAIFFVIYMIATTTLYLTKLAYAPIPMGAFEQQYKQTKGYLKGWELDTVIIASSVALMVLGGGVISLDALLGL